MDLTQFEPKPHRAKKIFKDKKIKRSTASRVLGISYSYLSSILSGAIQPSDEIAARLDRLADELEGKVKP
jgi:transcriptional regulator with XRE-family HTH domain